MNRILLADDSPHAQRMGERILREEGYEVVSVTDGETALLRLADVDPDVIIADVFLPGRSGMEICRYVKAHPITVT
jgi:CheY-like chemotaxis protein